MKRLLLLSLFAWFACDEAVAPDDAQDLNRYQSDFREGVEFDTPFALPVGEQAEVGQAGLQAGFHGVIYDSRCGLDVICIWAGMARIQVWLLEPGGDTLYVEPTISGYEFLDDIASHRQVFTEKYTISLLQLDPYPSAYRDTSTVQSDTAWLKISVNDFPYLQDRLLPIDSDTYYQLSHNRIDYVGIDSTTVAGDSLLVYVNYGGGCKKHDFYLFGTTGLEYSIMPMVQAVLIHDGHADFCEAFIHRTLRFDLLPVRQMVGNVSPVVIALPGSPDSIVYQF